MPPFFEGAFRVNVHLLYSFQFSHTADKMLEAVVSQAGTQKMKQEIQ